MHSAKLNFQRGKLAANRVVSPVRIYLKKDGKTATLDPKEGASLLVAQGSEISVDDLKRYGLENVLAKANGDTLAAEADAADARVKELSEQLEQAKAAAKELREKAAAAAKAAAKDPIPVVDPDKDKKDDKKDGKKHGK